MPLTPPDALISLIAIMVASCSDFSMIERPPVSENSTPTLISPAARAPVLNTEGDVINAPPASNPFLRNLRLSTAITPLPMTPRLMCQDTPHRSRQGALLRSRRSASFRHLKTCRSHRAPENAGASAVMHVRKNKKSPTDPRGSLGLPSRRPNQHHRWSGKVRETFLSSDFQKLITFRSVLQ